MKTLLKLSITFTALTVAASAQALYVEANTGYSNTGNAALTSGSTAYKRKQSKHLGWNVNVGQQFLGLIGVEAGYTQYAKTKWEGSSSQGSSKMSSYDLAIVLPFKLGPFFLQGKLGYGRINRGPVNVNNIHFKSKEHHNIFWGVGAGVYIWPSIYTSVQYQQMQGRDGTPNVNLASVGLGYKF